MHGLFWAQRSSVQIFDIDHHIGRNIFQRPHHSLVALGALRRIAWHWFRLLTGLNVTDLTSGFRCYRGDALRVLASSEATLLDYQDVGTLLMLRRAGLSVVEVPVRMNERVAGASRIFGSWLKVARYMAITTLLCLSRWRIGSARTRP